MKATIGLEIHLALATKKKLFSSTVNELPEMAKDEDGKLYQPKVNQFSLFDCATPEIGRAHV